MREPKPHVVSFLAVMLLLAGLATVADGPDAADTVAITVDQVGTEGGAGTPGDPGGGASPTGLDGTEVETEADGTPSPTDGATTTPGATGAAGGAPGTATPRSGSTGSTGSPGGASPTGGSSAGGGGGGNGVVYPEAALYDDKAKMRGFTDTQIVMCGHAALALGAAFDTSREDLNVYWDMLNEQGGIHGRKVAMSWEDDAYVAATAVRAATTCADKNPFMILGGIGFDQIPGVRDWAEENNELYLHHIAVAPTKTYNYSYSLSPTVELVGKEFGNFIAKEHRAAKLGIMFRDTPNWSPGTNAGKAVLDAKGVTYESYAVSQNQGVYTQQLNQMASAGIDTVWVWENALAAAQIINQATEQGYRPTWIVFPFQTTLDLLDDVESLTIDGVASWGSYAPGGYGGAFPEFGIDQEIARFEAAYAKYRPGTTPNDILWQVWVGNKIFHRMLNDCGKDCNRNRFAGMMLSGYQAQEKPACKINFADPRSFGNHHGGFAFATQRLFFPASGPAYETTRYCASTLG